MGNLIYITEQDISRLNLLMTKLKPPKTVKGVPVKYINGIGTYLELEERWIKVNTSV